MTQIHVILLLPNKNSRYDLLQNGPCGSIPPMAFWLADIDQWRPNDPTEYELNPADTRALVLAWNGAPVEEGMDRAHRCSILSGDKPAVEESYGTYWPPTLADALTLARISEQHGLGTLILLDADGDVIESV